MSTNTPDPVKLRHNISIFVFRSDNAENDIRDGITQLMFKCELSGITSTKYTVYALVLNEQEMKLRNENSKLILSA